MIDTQITAPRSEIDKASPLIPLAHTWALWSWVALRGAGFPAEHILRIVPPEIARAASDVLTREAHTEQLQQQALATLASERDQHEQEERQVLQKGYWRMRKGKLPEAINFACQSQEAVASYGEAKAQLAKAQEAFHQTYQRNIATERLVLRELAAQDDFREAVTWQNRNAFQQGISNFLRTEVENESESKQKQYKRLIVNYLQRYCVKNDSIGFFGPIGWLRLDPKREEMEVTPGQQLLAERTVYFEGWCIDALAEMFADNKELKRWLVPRRLPTIDLQGTKLFLGSGRTTQILPIQALVLQTCDGQRTAQEITQYLLKTAHKRFRNEKEIYSILEYLRTKGFLHWTLDMPYVMRSEQLFKELIERIDDPQMRAPLQQAYAELEGEREKVAQAAGNAEQLTEALDQLEETFSRLTGKAPTRMAGKTYAGRTLVFEDCRRDIEIRMGTTLLKALEPSLLLLLTSARWFTYEAAAYYRTIFKQLYDELCAVAHSRVIDSAQFWMRAYQFFFEERRQHALDDLEGLFHEHWHTILNIQSGQRRVSYTSEELRSQVERLFAAPHAGWKSARFHSPDILIAAPSVEAINRGEYQFVMGELHIARNTLDCALFVQQHPAPDELYQALKLSQPDPRILPVIPKQWPGLTSRILPTLFLSQDMRLMFSQDASGVPPEQALPISSLIMEETPAGLIVRTRDGKKQFDVIEVFSEALSRLVVNSFGLLHRHAYTPRVTIDRTVVCRETWRLPMAEMTFAKENDEQARFLGVRRWMRAHDMPRHVFVKVPDEMKPFYLDFDSPILVDIFAKALRRIATNLSEETVITISEMLPIHEDAWLPDKEGRRFTSELRFTAVDTTQIESIADRER